MSPLTMTAFDDAMPEPRFSSVNENYDSYDGGDGSGKSVDFGFTAAELAMVAARAEAEAVQSPSATLPRRPGSVWRLYPDEPRGPAHVRGGLRLRHGHLVLVSSSCADGMLP